MGWDKMGPGRSGALPLTSFTSSGAPEGQTHIDPFGFDNLAGEANKAAR